MLENFLLFCAGVDKRIIEQEECSTEKSKYSAIGGTILFTAALAFFSGGYAFWTVFKNYILSSFLGIVWALGIFNLDRSFVINIKKKREDKLLRLLGAVTPRFFLAVVIAFTISKPIELKLFERDIQAEIEKENISERNEQIKILSEDPRLTNLQEQLDNLNLQKKEIQKRISKKSDNLICEASGTCGTKVSGDGPAIQAIKEAQAQDEKAINQLDKDIGKVEQQIVPLKKANEEKLVEVMKAQMDADGFLRQLETFEKLSHFEQHRVIMLADWFITLLFILLETAPIIVKLLSERGTYEAIVEYQEEFSMYRYSEKAKAFSELVKHEIELYIKSQKDKQVFDFNTDIANYKRTRQTLKIVSSRLFDEVFDRALESREWNKSKIQLIDRLVKHLETELTEYMQGISDLDQSRRNKFISILRDSITQAIAAEMQKNSNELPRRRASRASN